MSDSPEDIPLSACQEFIYKNYVEKLLKFLRGESMRVATNQEYMKVYQLIIWQCDTNDNNEQIYEIFKCYVNDYLRLEVDPMITSKHGTTLL